MVLIGRPSGEDKAWVMRGLAGALRTFRRIRHGAEEPGSALDVLRCQVAFGASLVMLSRHAFVSGAQAGSRRTGWHGRLAASSQLRCWRLPPRWSTAQPHVSCNDAGSCA
ncbi:hypothetical protein ABL78_8388 [Leptomonas seymouri]|uniref:Uncharacterized protein n=1 Tax=Leptomonas seymouri TaxID=5684 RepID=A0A0N1HSR9_LEPSE|nr:hypothetical protein ABL78_8388 [Leptomonas seymouri]|eukprot:KPI82603.1 hypothetical protein ABL78_8388 [Leptomonas seymouri]